MGEIVKEHEVNLFRESKIHYNTRNTIYMNLNVNAYL